MSIEIGISLSIYFIGMLAIGWYAFRKTNDLNDYMLGGRGLGPYVTALCWCIRYEWMDADGASRRYVYNWSFIWMACCWFN